MKKMGIRVLSILSVGDKDYNLLRSYLIKHSSTLKHSLLETQEGFFCCNYNLFLESSFKDDLDYYGFKKEVMEKFKLKHFVSFLVQPV